MYKRQDQSHIIQHRLFENFTGFGKADILPVVESYIQGWNKHTSLDFLRELTNLAEGIPRYSSFMVMGIDDVLYMARKDDRGDIIKAIRRTLQSSAKDLERKMIQVQIVCKGKLFKADSFWLEYRDEKLPIDFIFGTPLKQQIRDCPVYTTGFNLSS